MPFELTHKIEEGKKEEVKNGASCKITSQNKLDQKTANKKEQTQTYRQEKKKKNSSFI